MSSPLWIVGQYVKAGAWEFQGVFSDKSKAIAACRNERYFIGPATLDEHLPAQAVKWSGLYYPLAEGDN